MESLSATSLLPGFGFHPTDVELISHYLKRKVHGQKIDFNIIPEVDIYKHEPWDLPAKCKIPTRDSKWHFFTSRDRKYPNGSRSNRATEGGYWKSTGKDRNIKSQNRVIGSKKTLVFHEGRPPSGKRTDWIMHEYYIDENECKAAPDMKDAYVLCRVTKRNGLPSEADNSPLPEEVNNHPQQPNETTESVICHKSTSPADNVDDIEDWLNELLDPNFSGITAPEDLKVEPEEGVTSVEPKLEPVDSSVEQNILDDSNFLLEEDIYSILYSNPDSYNYNLFEDLAMGNTDAPFASNGNWLTESNHNFPATNLEDEFFDGKALTHMNENNDAGIQIRKRHKKVAEASGTKSRLQVQLHKMETREAESVNQSVKLVDHYSLVDLVKEITESKSSLGSDDDSPKSGTLINGISYNRSVIRGFFVPLRDRTSAGLKRLFVGAFTVAIVGLILYVLFQYASRFTGSFSSIGYS
ncbi:NAC domain-containing protein 74-like isoform X2 [Ananas comosus]|uniref:NAC domain-containing protein 74-like isoform X2 n=1 Tax=Ananas comosus TaxID=4615 RepID=A0A6P5FMT3_ANACO|nr:NAC domain-containing protein 74-like isoform X2 [Ananas comosus]